MRIRSAIGASLACGTIILVGWQAGVTTLTAGIGTTVAATAIPPGTARPTHAATTATSSAPVSSPSIVPAAPAAPPSVNNGSFSGSALQTPYGTVQVRVVITGGKIMNVIPLRLTDYGSLSTEIDNQAVPMLKSEVLSSQTAKVDAVGGATYTSEGYLTSLQAALDMAHFAA